MKKELRQFFKHSALYGIGRGSIAISSLILLPIYTHILSPEELGVLELCSVIIALVAIFSTCSLSKGLLERCLHETSESDRSLWLRRTVTVTFLTASGVAVVFLAGRPLWNLATSMDPVWALSLVVACVFWIESFLPIPRDYFRAQDRADRFALLNFVQGLLTVTLVAAALLFVSREKVAGVLWARAAAAALTLMLAVRMTHRSLRGAYSVSGTKTLFKFSIPLIPTTAALLVLASSDRLFLTYFQDLGEVGVYGVGYRLGTILLLPFTIIQLSLPQRLVAWDKEESSGPKRTKALCLGISAVGGIVLLFVLFSAEIVQLIAPPEFALAASVVGPVALGCVAFGFYSLLGSGVYVTGSTRPLVLVTGSGMLLNVGLNFLVVPRWGATGAAWTTLATYAWMLAFVYLKVARRTPLGIGIFNIVKWILPALVLALLMAWRPFLLVTVLSKVCIFAAYLLAVGLQVMRYAKGSR